LLIAVFLLVVVILLAFAVIEVLIPLISPLNEFSVAAIITGVIFGLGVYFRERYVIFF
jgi:hypothetical protein